MKLTLSMDEIRRLVLNHYALPAETTIEISDTNIVSTFVDPDYNTLLKTLEKEDCLTPGGSIRFEKKIQSIKILRDLVCKGRVNVGGHLCGLSQAKEAVEDWSAFCDYVRKHGFPLMGSEDPSTGWLKK